MKLSVETTQEIGEIVKAVRKAQGLRQDQLAATIPASHVFVMQVERGKPSAHVGKVLALLRELGIKLILDYPNEAQPLLTRGKKTQSADSNG